MSNYLTAIYYSFPVQLLLLHLKKNQVLLLCWVILFMVITGNLGISLGIPYLFLDPEYLNQVNFYSFAIMGIAIAGFSVAFHITTYIIDGHRFSFLGKLSRPFSKFSLNNSPIPLLFLITYIYFIFEFQRTNEFSSTSNTVINILGLLSGYLIMVTLLYMYFRITNKDIFKYLVVKLDKNIKKRVKATRGTALQKLDQYKKKQIRVDNFISLNIKFEKVLDDKGFYNKSTVIQVFDQNHLNMVIIELLIFILLILMGIFRDNPLFQIPAAGSSVLFLTIFVMFTGAFSYWFRGWTITVVLILIFILNFVVKENLFKKEYRAFGISYIEKPAEYSEKQVKELNSVSQLGTDIAGTRRILNNWKKKFPSGIKPKMIFICASGGGQRAALWTLNVLQEADSLTGGNLMNQSILISGASGGLIGAAYFRELYYKTLQHQIPNLYDSKYLSNISNDHLNPIIFSLLVNDLFINLSNFNYKGQSYPKDRGYSFEEQMNLNTENILDVPLSYYYQPELEATIPMMIVAPTIMNDGRKLFISPHSVSYMNSTLINLNSNAQFETQGVDFLNLFKNHDAENLRFLSALRMAATFPYITPSVTLPSEPPISIMDAGITDNFGISDAIRFLYAFKSWISLNTSGVIILSIRDSEKEGPIKDQNGQSLFQKFSNPISSIYLNFENLQDFSNDNKIKFANSWFRKPIHRIDLQYVPMANQQDKRIRASLNWRLTAKEKDDIINSIHSSKNQRNLNKLSKLIK